MTTTTISLTLSYDGHASPSHSIRVETQTPAMALSSSDESDVRSLVAKIAARAAAAAYEAATAAYASYAAALARVPATGREAAARVEAAYEHGGGAVCGSGIWVPDVRAAVAASEFGSVASYAAAAAAYAEDVARRVANETFAASIRAIEEVAS